MHIDTMRRIDHWAGIPLTFLLTLVLTLRDRLRRPVEASSRSGGPGGGGGGSGPVRASSRPVDEAHNPTEG